MVEEYCRYVAGEKLKQNMGSAENPVTLSGDTVKDHIVEIEEMCGKTFEPRTISSTSPTLSNAPTEVILKTRNFTKEEAQKLPISLPLSIVEESFDSDLESNLIKCKIFRV